LVGRTTLALFSAWALTFAGAAFSQSYVIPVSIDAGPLPYGLQTLQRQTGIELLFDSGLVRDFQTPAIDGHFTTEDALRQLLAATDLTVRRAESGAWIVEPPDAPPLARPDAVVPEILVVGQRTQNADIRRFENDVQPYTVVTAAEIDRAHRDDIDQLFRSRITSTTTVLPPSLSQDGSTFSEIDLRGLGSEGTLVLVDGRRMPSIPITYAGFRQADLSAIPLHAIERIEVLTGAAGGIHGFGALGGVVNVVLDRESRGVDLHVTQGISSRGDGHRQGVEARFGRTSRDGATDFVLFAAYNQTDTVLVGDRDYVTRDRRKTFELAPEYYPGLYPFGNSVGVLSSLRFDPDTGEFELNPDLVFKPEFGGATLPSHQTFLPIGFSGNAEALVAALTQHAGEMDFSVPGPHAKGDLGSNPRSQSLLANVRHRFGTGLEVYADALVLRSRGESHGDHMHLGFSDGDGLLSPESPANPFTDYINVSYPIDGLEDGTWKRLETSRYTAGLVAGLPLDWRGTAEMSSGAFRYDASVVSDLVLSGSFLLLLGDPSDLDMNPLGDWDAFQRAIGADLRRQTVKLGLHSRFRNQSLRLAGPVFSTPAGPATLTLLAERRTEDVPAYTEFGTTETGGTTTLDESSIASRWSGTSSLYAELRTRLFDDAAPTPVLRNLELQLAVRRDVEKNDFARDATNPDSEFIHARFSGTAYTAGAKISPTRWLTLRGSYATGEQPPQLGYLIELPEEATTLPYATDPRRGDTDLGVDGEFLLRWGGSAGLKTVHASTTFLGAVLTPSGEDGPRFAIDYSRIRRTRDVLALSPQEIMVHEDFWSERIERAPLTDEDRANGYSAGRVTLLDMRYSNGAGLDVDTFDMHVDWPLRLFGGRLQLYADATYHMRNVLQAPFEPEVNMAGQRDGPLKWRANGGFNWSTDRLTIGANLQHFGSHLILRLPPLDGANDIYVQLQGSRKIPSQSYLDLHATWRLPVRNFGPVDDLSVNFGVVNVLDKAPPRENEFIFRGPGYSRYGDPRQRRFELGLSSHF
jgi:iron complex outermembrane recepter protein